jgi:hypothetical protein
MAAPETQFQTPGIQATGFSPTEYRATPVNVPSEAGALWAQVGKTALAAADQFGDTLAKSPLNPAVKEQMNYAINNYKLGETQNDYIRSLGPWGHLLVQTGPQGPTTISPGQITDPTMAARILQRMGIGITPNPPPAPGPQDKKTDTTTTTPPQTVPETGGQGYSASWGASAAERAAPSTATKPKTTQPTTTNPGDLLVPGSASTDNDFLLRKMMEDRQAAGLGGSQAAPQGTPPGMTFTNPATGNVEPLQTPSVFASRAAAPAPAAPTGQPQQPQPVSQTPAAATQSDQAAMQQWQEQNAHPVMSSQDALAWMKSQTTLAQDATYLPNGGPNGSPAYAFHMKGGGINTVPVTQMIQRGAGPVVAAQNTSAVLSKSDQLSGQRPGVTPMPSGTGAGAPQGPPTAAPAAPAGPQIAQQPSQGPPSAPGAYDPTAYQMPQGPTVTQTGAVNPALMAGGTNEQAAAAAKPAAPPGFDAPAPDLQGADQSALRTYSMEELAKMDADPTVGNIVGLPFRQDRHDGRVYAVQRSPSSTLNEMRWYWGSQGFQDGPMDESTMRQTVRNLRDHNVPGFGKYTDEYTRTMPVQDLIAAVNLGNSYLATGGDPQGTTANHIKGTTQQAQSITRMIDALEAAKKAGINPKEYSQLRVDQSRAAAERDAIMPDDIRNPADILRGIQARIHDWNADGGPVRPLADELSREAQYFGTQMGQTPGITYTAEGRPENKGTTVTVAGVPIHLPGNIDTSPLDQINRIFASQPHDDVIKGLKEVRKKLYDDINSSTDLATRLNFRTPPSFKAVQDAINNGQDIPDETNKFKAGLPSDEMLHGKPIPPRPSNFYKERLQPLLDKWFGQQNVGNVEQTFLKNTVFGGTQQSASTPSGAIQQTSPTQSPTPMVEFDNVEDGANFVKSHKSGTYFKVKGQTFKVD